MWKMLSLFVVLLFMLGINSVGTPAQANVLPDTPIANGKPIEGVYPLDVIEHKTVNTEFKIWIVAMGASWAADTVTTKQLFDRCPYCHEVGPIGNGSRNVALVMGSYAAIDVGVAIAMYEWKRHIKNKKLNQLWRLMPAKRISAHTYAAVSNSTFMVMP